jgi:hypothetical protein
MQPFQHLQGRFLLFRFASLLHGSPDTRFGAVHFIVLCKGGCWDTARGVTAGEADDDYSLFLISYET